MPRGKHRSTARPGGRVELSDIRAKLQDIRGDTDHKVDQAMPYALVGAVAAGVALVAVAFILGRSRGRRKATWVEIRRL